MDSLIILVILEIGIVTLGIWMIWSTIFGIPWLPTPRNKVRAMLEFASVTPEDTVYDLGSGDGRIVVMAAKEFGAQSVGIEIDPIRYQWSRFAIRRNKVTHKAQVIRENFFKTNLEDATVITIYGGKDINKQIGEKLKNTLKSGTRVVSYRFIIGGWTPVETDKESSLYLYVV